MPEKTKSEFRDDGFFITGDLGKIDDKGYVHILGRGKDLVISGGFNVYPKEIESEIDAMPGVIESAVIGVPHADFGEGVTAVVVCNKGADVSEAGVLQALDGRLANSRCRSASSSSTNCRATPWQGAEEYFAGYLREDLREVVVAVATT
jgi:malonyl-CoA/methylmalonyl-CoA synthetase